ncbi:DNA-binding transcriptional regulator, PadR family [Propionibacterium cyclohexanicum]|uniref:DNA-binding transcriptional regulator, PadR family n=2 Tax=Propionibacterium cyclohexanicum TaxID=64702 RepID=A0A1H9SU30_9ACTN|nr:DNA-binding transcriptional regulator, PadR family [Propionibacterium cyclohexanicum]
MSVRKRTLELAILGRLEAGPVHGYELGKHLAVMLGPFRSLSYGSLYPALKALTLRGLIHAQAPERPATGARKRTVYALTHAGRDYLHEWLRTEDTEAWNETDFDVRFALFGSTDADTRLRILENRRTHTAEALVKLRHQLDETGTDLDDYTRELVKHGLDNVERELNWLEHLIESESHRRI